MMKAIIFCGEPAVGKTTLIKHIIKQFGGIEQFNYQKKGLVKHHTHKKLKLAVWGVFTDMEATFASTDKWSMATQPEFLFWLKAFKHQDRVFIGEGDRIATQEILQTMKDTLGEENCILIMLTATQPELAERHAERGDTQTTTYLKGRATKYKNLLEQVNGFTTWENTTAEQAEENRQKAIKLVKKLMNEVDNK